MEYVMYKCQYCDRELKSKAGQLRHESSCEAKDIAEVEENTEVSTDVVVSKPRLKEVTLEVLGGAETYYDGHPRRLTKLKGMLSATFDRAERHKIQQLILKVENENAYER